MLLFDSITTVITNFNCCLGDEANENFYRTAESSKPTYNLKT